MLYVLSIALVAMGLIVLGALAFQVAKALRRFNHAVSMVSTNTQDGVGLLRARSAGVRVAIARRVHRNNSDEQDSKIGLNELGGHR
ncbi:bacteriophage holin [Amycolatopsis palatopharyngis]|uniref:bacteriophage holin n=1 Tax=Amycolatopsis palatopharyngis TaxID=187982 RepID=UPI0013BE9BF9|nr:bacteriophage holin [Amycolatopsis palatopharyngis]